MSTEKVGFIEDKNYNPKVMRFIFLTEEFPDLKKMKECWNCNFNYITT
jgi:hypothetical protein